MSGEELADPRIVSTSDLVGRLGTVITETLLDARGRTLDRLELEYSDAPIAGVSNFDSIARNAINVALSEGRVQEQARPMMQDAIERTIDRLSSPVHSPQIETIVGSRAQQQARFYARSVELSTRNAADDMLDRMRTGVRNAATRGETLDVIERRITDEFSRDKINNRARLIARMEIQNAIQSTKLAEYDRSPAVEGYRIINPCNQNTTRLCEHLAGCGPREAAVVWFDTDQSLSSQLQEQAREDLLFEGFAPIPPIPPFHFNCRSGIAPAVRDNT